MINRPDALTSDILNAFGGLFLNSVQGDDP